MIGQNGASGKVCPDREILFGASRDKKGDISRRSFESANSPGFEINVYLLVFDWERLLERMFIEGRRHVLGYSRCPLSVRNARSAITWPLLNWNESEVRQPVFGSTLHHALRAEEDGGGEIRGEQILPIPTTV